MVDLRVSLKEYNKRLRAYEAKQKRLEKKEIKKRNLRQYDVISHCKNNIYRNK